MKNHTALLEASVVMIVMGAVALVATFVFPYLSALVWLAVVLLGLATVPPLVRRSQRMTLAGHNPRNTL